MKYTVNYRGQFFSTDSCEYNTYETNNFREAMELLGDIINLGIDYSAYIKDEEYQCSMHWDRKEKEFYWEG